MHHAFHQIGHGKIGQREVKERNDTAAVRKRGAAGQNIFQIGADRVCRQVFLIHIGELQIEAAVGVAGMPAERIESLADRNIVGHPVVEGTEQHGVKRLRRRGFLHHIVQEGVMDHFCKKFKKKAFGIRKILFCVEEQQAVGALTMLRDVDAEGTKSRYVIRKAEPSIEIADGRVFAAFCQGEQKRARCIEGAKHLLGKKGRFFGRCGDDGKIHADHHQGVGKNRQGEI